MFKGLCPFCHVDANYKRIMDREMMTIHGETLLVNTQYIMCQACSKEFDDPTSSFDRMEAAYAAYEKKTGKSARSIPL